MKIAGVETDNTSHDVSIGLRTLIRGLTQNNPKEIYAGHRALYRIGAPAIPGIQDAINKSSWAKVRYPNEIRFLIGLVSVLHDIDETESRKTAEQLKQGGCDLAVGRLLDSVCRFTTADYVQYKVLGINIFEQKKLVIKRPVRPKLEQWLKNIPEEDLKEVERIYILTRDDLQASGTYTPILYNIRIVWDNPYSRFNPISYFYLYVIENTLYHEVGHHAYRHTFGQEDRKEKEADDYSLYVMSRTNHLHFRVMRALFGSLPHPFEKRRTGS